MSAVIESLFASAGLPSDVSRVIKKCFRFTEDRSGPNHGGLCGRIEGIEIGRAGSDLRLDTGISDFDVEHRLYWLGFSQEEGWYAITIDKMSRTKAQQKGSLELL